MSSDNKKWSKTEKDRKNMEKENNTDESGDIRFKFFCSLLNLNQKQTLKILTLVAVMMRKKVLNIK